MTIQTECEDRKLIFYTFSRLSEKQRPKSIKIVFFMLKLLGAKKRIISKETQTHLRSVIFWHGIFFGKIVFSANFAKTEIQISAQNFTRDMQNSHFCRTAYSTPCAENFQIRDSEIGEKVPYLAVNRKMANKRLWRIPYFDQNSKKISTKTNHNHNIHDSRLN